MRDAERIGYAQRSGGYSVAGSDDTDPIRQRPCDFAAGGYITVEDRGRAMLHKIRLCSTGELARIVVHRRGDGFLPGLLPRRDRQCGQEADDDDHNHDLNKGKPSMRVETGVHCV